MLRGGARGLRGTAIDNDEEKNRLCPPSPLSSTPTDWLAMQVIGVRAGASFGSDPDVKAWADGTSLNPTHVPDGFTDFAALDVARERMVRYGPAGRAWTVKLSGVA